MKKAFPLIFALLSACAQAPQSIEIRKEIRQDMKSGEAARVTAVYDSKGELQSCAIAARSESCASEAVPLCYQRTPAIRKSQFCM